MKAMTFFYKPLRSHDKPREKTSLDKSEGKDNFLNQTKPEMKESAQFLTVIMAIIFGFAAIANNNNSNDEKVQIVPDQVGVFKLVYLERSPETVHVTIYNNEGRLTIKDEVNPTEGFIKSYDLRDSGSGKYTFRIKNSKEVLIQEIYFDKALNFLICQMGNTGKFKFSKLNKEPLEVSVFNRNDQLLLSDNIKAVKSRTYDLSKFVDSYEGITFTIKENNRLLKKATF